MADIPATGKQCGLLVRKTEAFMGTGELMARVVTVIRATKAGNAKVVVLAVLTGNRLGVVHSC